MRTRMVIAALLCTLGAFIAACMPEAEWVIPEDFKTYTDPEGLYSISYPSDWRMNLQLIRQVEQDMKDYIKEINEGIPVERATLLFLAGIPHSSGYHPNVNIVIEPRPSGIYGLRGMVNGEIAGMEAVAESFQEISRQKVKAGGRDAYIIEYVATLANMGGVHGVMLLTMTGETVWSVTCSSLEGLDDFDAHAEEFQSIVRSLRVHDE
jgi:hypothetical protein